MSRRGRWLLPLLVGTAAAAGAPVLSAPGLHVLSLDSPVVARWLGPGLAPVWSDDGHRLCVASRTNLWRLDPVTGAAEPPEPLRDYEPTTLPLAQGELSVSADGKRLLGVDPLTGQPLLLAELESPGPVKLALSPDLKSLAVSLGDSDRGGLMDLDRVNTQDVNVAGRTCAVVRRVRSVAASGLVFAPAKLAFRGQAAPVLDSPVATEARAGGYRWDRPGPPRWVVLHHTATATDGPALNGLTTQSPGLLAQRYDDVTPNAQIRPEPSSLSVHYVVRRNGGVVQLVEERYLARHAGTGQWGNRGPSFDFNPESIGIEIVSLGNSYTPEQVRSVGRLVADICRRHHLPLARVDQPFQPGVLYHRDFAAGLRGKPDPAGWPWEQMLQAAGG